MMVDNPLQVSKHASLWIMIALIVFDGLSLALPQMKALMSPETFTLVNIAFGIAASVAKFIRQNLSVETEAAPSNPQQGRARPAALLAVVLMALLVACASAPSKNAAALSAYQTIDAYVLLIENRVDRGLITKAEATRASLQAKQARGTVEQAEAAFASCKPPATCTDGTALLQSVQPLLLQYEKQLREQQGAKP